MRHCSSYRHSGIEVAVYKLQVTHEDHLIHYPFVVDVIGVKNEVAGRSFSSSRVARRQWVSQSSWA